MINDTGEGNNGITAVISLNAIGTYAYSIHHTMSSHILSLRLHYCTYGKSCPS